MKTEETGGEMTERLSLYKKLLVVQREIGAITKESTNPFYKSKYFDINKLLEVVKPALNKHGLVLTQPLDGNTLKTLILDADSGEYVASMVSLPDNPDPQKRGSIITYFRRYSLQSLLALQAEDDDAESASHPEPKHPNNSAIETKLNAVGKFFGPVAKIYQPPRGAVGNTEAERTPKPKEEGY